MNISIIFDLDATLIDGNSNPRPGIKEFVEQMSKYPIEIILATHSKKSRIDKLIEQNLLNVLGIEFDMIYPRECFESTNTNVRSNWRKTEFVHAGNEKNVVLVVDDNTDAWKEHDYVGSPYTFAYCSPFLDIKECVNDLEFQHALPFIMQYLKYKDEEFRRTTP